MFVELRWQIFTFFLLLIAEHFQQTAALLHYETDNKTLGNYSMN